MMLIRLLIAASVIVCSSFSFTVLAKQNIATVSPISYSLSKAIVNNTPVEVAYLPPKRLPVNRVPSWLRKSASNKFEAYDVFVSTSAVNSGLDFFPTLRQSNIRLVDIDIAQAIMPSGEKVVLAAEGEYFWLNTNNLLLMLGILKRDISAMWPAYSKQFNDNYQTLASKIRQVNLALDDSLMNNEIAFIVARNEKLSPFVASLASDTSSEQEVQELGLEYVTLSSGKKAKKGTWHIDDLSRFSEKPLAERLHQSIQSLQALIQSKR